MEKMNLGNPNFPLTPWESLLSKRNRLFFVLRRRVAFQRGGYTEKGRARSREEWLESLPAPARTEALRIINKFNFYSNALSPVSDRWSLWTLWLLENMFSGAPRAELAVDFGCQDFRRLPALRCFLGPKPRIVGLEIDPYRILSGFHSRADIAEYFVKLDAKAEYLPENAFSWTPRKKAGAGFAFFPFVSPHPALAWGLPAELGAPDAWLSTLHRSLLPGAYAFVLHQGRWEEEEFDEARERLPGLLELVDRKRLICPFFPMNHPPHASLYRTKPSC